MNRGILGMPVGKRGRINYAPNEFSGCRVVRKASLSVAINTVVYIPWDTIRFDTDSYMNVTNFPTRLVAPHAGYYDIGAEAIINPSGTAARSFITIDYGTIMGGSAVKRLARTDISVSTTGLPVATLAYFGAGDFAEIGIFQAQANPRVMGGADDVNEVFMCAYMTRRG